MIETKKMAYQKAYTELNEIFKCMPEEQLNKIPKFFIANVQKEMDKNYNFQLEQNKNLEEQNLMAETKALLVQIYKNFLADENEKETWKKYDKLCTEKIEEHKREQHNPDDIFKKKQNYQKEVTAETTEMIVYKKENFFMKLVNKIKSIFTR